MFLVARPFPAIDAFLERLSARELDPFNSSATDGDGSSHRSFSISLGEDGIVLSPGTMHKISSESAQWTVIVEAAGFRGYLGRSPNGRQLGQWCP